jgi:hypothetical protein
MQNPAVAEGAGEGMAEPEPWLFQPLTGALGPPCPVCRVERTPQWLVAWVVGLGEVTTCNSCASYARRHNGARRPRHLIRVQQNHVAQQHQQQQ